MNPKRTQFIPTEGGSNPIKPNFKRAAYAALWSVILSAGRRFDFEIGNYLTIIQFQPGYVGKTLDNHTNE